MARIPVSQFGSGIHTRLIHKRTNHPFYYKPPRWEGQHQDDEDKLTIYEMIEIFHLFSENVIPNINKFLYTIAM
ncbi:hypothetical protein GCM10008018_22620 [Paenibacillus marchantiophytorum]|uniref:Uncharacterized protein n=1 Tax=Paenibacillus marchantiophytorum TaxID=1619310 RepID=A0ABQ1EKZ2_9BACL|nr:hypothetical protein GCM10008018_22620 [Paenibacillus marchantiophytorum]